MRDLILFWLRSPGFSTARNDSLLVTDSPNSLASQFWEGQLRTALKNGSVRHLFENTDNKYFGKGFEMLQVLEDTFHPSLISNSFTTLLSLFNDTQGDKEGLHEFRSRFEGHLGALSRSSVAIPPILQVMLFLQALHARYGDLLSQFALKQKDLSTTTIDSAISDAKFMDEFTVVGAGGKPKPGLPSPSPCSPAAALVVTNGDGKRYHTPFEWLASYNPGALTNRWQKSLGGNFYCAFCNGKEKHHPTKCPLLGELGLKLIDVSGGTRGSSSGSTSSAGARGGVPPATPPAAAPAAVVPPPASALGSPSAPAGLTATVEAGDESSTDSFCWDGDDERAVFKPNGSVSMYPPPPVGSSLPLPISSLPSCSRVSLESDPLSLLDVGHLPDDIILPPGLVSALDRAISPEAFVEGLRLVVADTGATDHMVPDCSAFISYKVIRNLCVCMGNNSFAPVLGWGTAIISLNGQRILIRHVLHVPALWVPFTVYGLIFANGVVVLWVVMTGACMFIFRAWFSVWIRLLTVT